MQITEIKYHSASEAIFFCNLSAQQVKIVLWLPSTMLSGSTPLEREEEQTATTEISLSC